MRGRRFPRRSPGDSREKEGHAVEEPRGFLVGLIIGGGIGALLGVLFAPESGEVTRERVRDQGQRVTGRVREQANRVADEVRIAAQNVAGEVRERADEFATRAQGAAEKMVHRGRTTLEEEPTP